MNNYSFQSPLKSQHRYAQNINGYQIKEQIGKGGFGVVYRAISQSKGSFQEEVAIKMINKQDMRKLKLTKRVANEVEIHWQLRHPAVLELYNYFEDSEYVYLVMEICQNGNLYQFLDKDCLSESQTRGLMTQLVGGLVYLHSNGIIHRDLKLSNLLLNRSFTLKIADFGLAVKLKDPAGEQKTMCGTPNYISPYQVIISEIVSRMPYGLASDIWALGCMMVTLLTGSPPFQSSAVKNTLEKVSRVEYNLPSYVSEEARDLIGRLLQKVWNINQDPNDRIHLDKILRHSFFDSRYAITDLCARTNVFQSHPKQGQSRDCRESSHARSMQISSKVQPVSIQKIQIPEEFRLDIVTFTTIRLKPIIQDTKHGRIEILRNLDLLLDFKADSEIIKVKADGKAVHVFLRGQDPEVSAVVYKVENIPNRYHKKVRYASRFVDLVRSKTPKVSFPNMILFYSPLAKCTLMENAPRPDFIAAFYNGIRVQYFGRKDFYEIKIPRDLSNQYKTKLAKESSQGLEFTFTDIGKLDSIFMDIYRHFEECHRQCLDIDERERNPNAKYPMIFKSNQSPRIIPARTNTPPTSIHPSINNTFSTSIPTSRKSSGDMTDTNTRVNTCTYTNINANSNPSAQKKSNSYERNSESHYVGSRVKDSQRQGLDSVISISQKFTPLFIKDIGWCVQTPDKRFSMLFQDGVQLVVDPKSQSLEYAGDETLRFLRLTRFDIDKRLPGYIKSRLAYFPKFFKLFKDQ